MGQGHDKSSGRPSIHGRPRIPPVWLMTDERVPTAALLRAAARLPRGSAIILRHYERAEPARRALFEQLRSIARRRACRLLLAGDPAQAYLWGADGHHGRTPAPIRTSRTGRHWLHSMPVHDANELAAAIDAGADAILLSPLFATRSHPGAPALGPARFAALARRAPMPVIALGGVRPRHARLIRRLGAAGYAAIDGLTARS